MDKFGPEPTTKKMADAIKWSQNAGRDTERYFSAGGFVAPDPDSYLLVECPDCKATVQVLDGKSVKNATCPYCDHKLYLTSKRELAEGVKRV